MSECIHTLYKKADGYAQVTINYKVYAETHLVYAAYNNVSVESIKGKVIRHTCDNPYCVNPEHLVIGTHKDNTADMFARGRANRIPKLSAAQITSIRNSCGNLQTLAVKFNVNRSTISKVINRAGGYSE